MAEEEESVAKISDFLRELEDAQSSYRKDWDARDREKAMKDFGLDDPLREKIRTALETGDLDPITEQVEEEIGTEQAAAKPLLWVK